jgi:RHS repeat-associated protein
VVAVTDADGERVGSYNYTAFGTIKDATGALDNNITYTGRWLEPETGLYYYRARYYDSGVGRFLKRDSIGFWAKDLNFYRYANNNSINYYDPIGLDSKPTEWMMIGYRDVNGPENCPGPNTVGYWKANIRYFFGRWIKYGSSEAINKSINMLGIQNRPLGSCYTGFLSLDAYRRTKKIFDSTCESNCREYLQFKYESRIKHWKPYGKPKSKGVDRSTSVISEWYKGDCVEH